MKLPARSLVAALSLGVLLVLSRQPAAAATAYLTLSGPNPFNGTCPATLNFTGHIDGPASSSVTYNFAWFTNGAWFRPAAVTATIPAGGSLPLTGAVTADTAHQGLQSYEVDISAPAGSDSATHGKVFYTVHCSTLVAVPTTPLPLRPVIVLPVSASIAYFRDATGANFICGRLTHYGTIPTDFGGAVAVGYTHSQTGGPNGDPCGVHDDVIYRIMLASGFSAIHGRLSSVVLTATHTGTDANTACKLDALTRVSGAFREGDVHDASGFSTATGVSWYSSNPTSVHYQIYPTTDPIAGPATNALLQALFGGGGTLQLMLRGPNEHIDRDNLRCLLKFTTFKLNVIAG